MAESVTCRSCGQPGLDGDLVLLGVALVVLDEVSDIALVVEGAQKGYLERRDDAVLK